MNVFRTFFEGRALVSKDSNRSPIHLKIELDNGTDFEEKLDNVEVYREFWPSVCLVKISAWHDFLPCWIFQQHMPHSMMHLMAWSRQRRHPHSKWPHRETNDTNSLLWWKDYLLWWQTTIFFSCASVGPLNKQMVLLSRRFNQSWDPRTVTIWIRQVLWYVSGFIFFLMFFPFPFV